ncbi:MAG: DUF2520 domain-containing protein, partial [Alphaproteobacteria bacterium]|nr:DUF2520 domain-containing protein [Alphaproteobacteria bacterium]
NKPLYHALCVMSGNFPNILWNSCLNVFKSLNIPQEAAFLYLQKTLENFCKDPKNSLTGPLVRNDKDTIDKNLTALSPNMRDVYKAFVKFYFNQFKNV